MKRLLLGSLLTIVALPALGQQTVDAPVLSRFGATYSIDFYGKGKDGKKAISATPAIVYRTTTFSDVLPTILKGRYKLSLDLDGVAGAQGNGGILGMGLLYTHAFTFQSTGDRNSTFGVTFGPSYLYGTEFGKARFGLVAGLMFQF